MGTNTDFQAYNRSNWLQGMMTRAGVDSSSTPMGGSASSENVVFGGERSSVERRLGRPQDEQALKCPRCESTHTKFCYYNNYSLSQPRYFCKTCRRYWTKGGTIRNIPVGGGCRKNSKKASTVAAASRKLSTDFHSSSVSPSLMLKPESNSFSSFPFTIFSTDDSNPANLHLTFPEQLQFSSPLNAAAFTPDPEFLIGNPLRFDIMEAKNEPFMATGDKYPVPASFNDDGCGSCLSLDHNGGDVLERFLMIPYGGGDGTAVDVKPDAKILLPHENHNHVHGAACCCCSNSNTAKDTFGYNLGSWAGFMGGYGCSATNPLV